MPFPRLLIILFISGLYSFAATGAHADESAHEKLQRISEEINKIEQSIAKNTRDKDQLRVDMQQMDKRIGQLHGEIRQLNQHVSTARKRAQQLTAEQKRLQTRLADQAQSFSHQARMAYLYQRQSKFKLILAQNSIQEAGRIAVMYDYVNQARLQQMERSRQLAEQVAQNRDAVQAEQTRLQDLIHAQAEQRKLLQRARNQKQQAQQAVTQLIDQDQSRLKRAQKDQRAIKKLLRKLPPASPTGSRGFATQKGRLAWPLNGRMLNRYGAAKSGSATIVWDGVSIKAPRGSEIHAIYPGTVVFSDWFQGYGWLLIIDHGNDFMSLYAHAETLHKNVGEAVVKGENIGLVGDSGGASQPSLYFEIRHGGAPVNPNDWCTVPKVANSS